MVNVNTPWNQHNKAILQLDKIESVIGIDYLFLQIL